MADYNNQPKIKKILDNAKLKLSAKPQGGGRPPSLQIETFNQNPQFIVWTGVPSDAKKRISANMDPVVFYQVLIALEELANAGPEANGMEYNVKNKHTSRDGQKLETPEVVSRTLIGRDEKGLVYISVEDMDERRPKIRFYFGYNKFHIWGSNGDQLSHSFLSCNMAKGWVRVIRDLYPTSILHEELAKAGLIPPAPAGGGGYNKGGNSGGGGGYNKGGNSGGYNKGGQGNSGGYNKGGQSGGGYNKGGNESYGGGSDDDDDELPF